jgi:hypothetical protein
MLTSRVTQSLTRQTMYVQGNIEAPSRNHGCSKETISITCSNYIFVVLGIQHAMRTRLWPVRLYNISPHLINGTSSEKIVIEHKMCVLIGSTNFVWNISHSKKKLSRYGQKCIWVLIVVLPCILISIKLSFQRMHYLLKHKILQFVFKCLFYTQPLHVSVPLDHLQGAYIRTLLKLLKLQFL